MQLIILLYNLKYNFLIFEQYIVSMIIEIKLNLILKFGTSHDNEKYII